MAKIMSRPWFQDQGNLDFLHGLGRSLMQNAGTQGFGALNDALGAGIDYRGAMSKQRLEEADRKEKGDREDVRWEHYMEQWNAAKTQAEKDRIAKEAELVSERERRRQALEMLPPEQKGRLGLLAGESFWKEWTKATNQEPPEAPDLVSDDAGNRWRWSPNDPTADKNGFVLVFPADKSKSGGAGSRVGQVRQAADGSLIQYLPSNNGADEHGWVQIRPPGDKPLTSNQLILNSRIEAGRIYGDMMDRLERILEASKFGELNVEEAAQLVDAMAPGIDPLKLRQSLARKPTVDQLGALLPSYEDIRKKVLKDLSGGELYRPQGNGGGSAPGSVPPKQPASESGAEQEVQRMAAGNPQVQQVVQRLRSEGKDWDEILRLMQEAGR